jgi:phosphopantothenoylcysteine decarboxylase / phosphopantothenate---cysteine ligase
VANDVSPETGVMGGDENTVHIISATATDTWPKLAKGEVAHRLAAKIAAHLKGARA